MDDLSLQPNDDRSAAERAPRTRAARGRHSRAVRLVERLIGRELASVEGLAGALAISTRQLEEYRTGRCRVPLQTQRQLADLVIGQVPELIREARRLQLQCDAEEAFHSKETATHMIAPPAKFR